MEEATLTQEEFVGLVGIFRLLQKWRDERNQRILADENSAEINERKEPGNEKRNSEPNSIYE